MMRWDDVFKKVLADLVDQPLVIAGQSKSVGSERTTLEKLNYKFVLENPRDRILWSPAKRFNLFGAIARFFWMIAGNDRLKDIAFYEPKVLGFSDDELTVPGSNYGKRLFMPEPGLDQVKAAVQRIRNEPGTRRAVAAIYRAEDAVRESKDIPCAFGLAFHPRNERLHVTMIMRSNAAWLLLPFNVFEFTLLGELVAVLSDVPLGSYTHYALSMHLYKGEAGRDEEALAREAIATPVGAPPSPMPAMPKTSFEDLKRILKWEADVRYDAKGINATNYRDYIQRCRDSFHPYWVQLCLPLLAFVLFTNKRTAAGLEIVTDLQSPLREALLKHPLTAELSIPGLEEDRDLLSSRLSLLEYAEESKDVSDARREALWGRFHSQFVTDFQKSGSLHARERRSTYTKRDWKEMDKSLGDQSKPDSQPDLFG